MTEIDPEDLCGEDVLVILVSTYTDGRPPQTAKVRSQQSKEADLPAPLLSQPLPHCVLRRVSVPRRCSFFVIGWLRRRSTSASTTPSLLASPLECSDWAAASTSTTTMQPPSESALTPRCSLSPQPLCQQQPTSRHAVDISLCMYVRMYVCMCGCALLQLYPHLVQLGASPLCPLGLADDSVARTAAGTAETDWRQWRDAQLLPALERRVAQPLSFQQHADGQRRRRKEEQQRDKEREEKEAEEVEQKAAGDDAGQPSPALLDVEELGAAVAQQLSSARSVQPVEQSAVVQLRARASASPPSTGASAPSSSVRPMLTEQLRAALSKQGYKLLGSHSGVKLCRWTKAMLRGRGGCYKNT